MENDYCFLKIIVIFAPIFICDIKQPGNFQNALHNISL